jgi:hypothetical protein
MAHLPNDDDTELDDILSQIMQGGPAQPVHRPAPEPPKPKPVQKRRAGFNPHPITSSVTNPELAAKVARRKKARRKTRHMPLAGVLAIAVTVLVVASVGSYFLYAGPLHTTLSRSPFSATTKQKYSSFALYYPTRLPKGYVINKDSFTSPTDGVLVYSIINGTKNITVSMQAQPAGLNISKLLATYSGTHGVTTPIGSGTVGVQDNTTLIAHFLTGKTWMIVNTDVNTLPKADFETILKSLKQG